MFFKKKKKEGETPEAGPDRFEPEPPQHRAGSTAAPGRPLSGALVFAVIERLSRRQGFRLPLGAGTATGYSMPVLAQGQTTRSAESFAPMIPAVVTKCAVPTLEYRIDTFEHLQPEALTRDFWVSNPERVEHARQAIRMLTGQLHELCRIRLVADAATPPIIVLAGTTGDGSTIALVAEEAFHRAETLSEVAVSGLRHPSRS